MHCLHRVTLTHPLHTQTPVANLQPVATVAAVGAEGAALDMVHSSGDATEASTASVDSDVASDSATGALVGIGGAGAGAGAGAAVGSDAHTAGVLNDSESMPLVVSLLQRGDIVKVLPGAAIPSDGVVVAGSTSVNESMVTGEARPVTKGVGSAVIGGTVNNWGAISVSIQRVPQEGTLSQICRLVEQAQTSKAPAQLVADKVRQ